MNDEELRKAIYLIDAAFSARDKANRARYQTGDAGMNNTIINVNYDEAVVIKWALDAYIDKYAKEKEE